MRKHLCFGLDGIVSDFVVGEQKGQFESTRIRQRDELDLTLLLSKSLGGGDFAASILFIKFIFSTRFSQQLLLFFACMCVVTIKSLTSLDSLLSRRTSVH